MWRRPFALCWHPLSRILNWLWSMMVQVIEPSPLFGRWLLMTSESSCTSIHPTSATTPTAIALPLSPKGNTSNTLMLTTSSIHGAYKSFGIAWRTTPMQVGACVLLLRISSAFFHLSLAQGRHTGIIISVQASFTKPPCLPSSGNPSSTKCGFKPLRMVGDSEMWHRLAQDFPVLLMPHGMVWYRFHDDQESNEIDEFALSYSAIVHQYLSSENCPLNSKELHAIYSNRRRRLSRTFIIHLLKRNFKAALAVSAQLRALKPFAP